jgi:hypothetical protein
MHVEEVTLKKVDLMTFDCWVLCKDPSRIPQMVYMLLGKSEPGLGGVVHVQSFRPREYKNNHVVRVLIHVDTVEDLLFYRYPCGELLADGDTSWKEFRWQLGQLDGDVFEDDLHPTPSIYDQDRKQLRRRPRDDDDHDLVRSRPRARSIPSRMSRRSEGQGRSRERHDWWGKGSGGFAGSASHGRTRRERSPPPSSSFPAADENIELRLLWCDKGKQAPKVDEWQPPD